MTPRLPHWLAAGGLALAVHVAAFIPLDVDKRSAAEQSAGAPEAVWGLSEVALTETAEPQPSDPPVEPVEKTETVAPQENAALRPVAPAETAPVAIPETAEPPDPPETATQPTPETAETAEPEETETAQAETAEPVEKKQEQEPVEEPVERPLKKPEKPEAKEKTASGGPVGRAAGSEGGRPSASGRASFSNYAGRIAAHLRRYKRYPDSAGRSRGTVRVSFAVSRSGALRSVRIVSGSGNAALDRAAIRMVRRAAPFPRMPANINRQSASFSVPIRFSR